MPKETTHLWFAESLVGKTRAEGMRVVISGGKPSYCLGSIIPDTFYYSFSPSLERISGIIHGRDGRPTNALILSVLVEARGPDDIAFILGYITHCALDITFHPMVESLSGNYYDQDPARREDAVTRHRFLETCIDVRTGNTLRIHELVRPRLLRGLVFEDIVGRDFCTTLSFPERPPGMGGPPCTGVPLPVLRGHQGFLFRHPGPGEVPGPVKRRRARGDPVRPVRPGALQGTSHDGGGLGLLGGNGFEGAARPDHPRRKPEHGGAPRKDPSRLTPAARTAAAHGGGLFRTGG